MPALLAHPRVQKELAECEPKLRARLSAHLFRLMLGQTDRLRTEKVAGAPGLRELKISWNKQEFRFLYYDTPNGAVCLLVLLNKKQRKLPQSAIQTALTRKEDIELGRTFPVSTVCH